MKMTPKIIEAAIKMAPQGLSVNETAREFANLLDEWEKIAAALAGLRTKAEKLREEAEKKQREIQAAIDAIRRTCPHPSTTHRDAGIYGDSCNECDVCGANTRPKPERGLDRR